MYIFVVHVMASETLYVIQNITELFHLSTNCVGVHTIKVLTVDKTIERTDIVVVEICLFY